MSQIGKDKIDGVYNPTNLNLHIYIFQVQNLIFLRFKIMFTNTGGAKVEK